MSKLDDFLAPLHQGIWEVIVPKEEVSEPLGKEWSESKVNVPSPDTIASYRKGRYHCHETESDWRVHMDLYDPVDHPVMHLVDDAPLVLMFGGAMESLWVDAKNTRKMDKKELLDEHKIAWQLLLLTGVFLLLIGGIVAIKAGDATDFFIVVVLPLIIICFAAFIILQGSRIKPKNTSAKKNIILGCFLVAIGVLAFVFPALLVLLMIAFLGIWPIASAIVSLKRAKNGKIVAPKEFNRRLTIAFLSIALGILFFLAPVGVAKLIIYFVAVIIILMGVLYLFRALGVRSALKEFRIGRKPEGAG